MYLFNSPGFHCFTLSLSKSALRLHCNFALFNKLFVSKRYWYKIIWVFGLIFVSLQTTEEVDVYSFGHVLFEMVFGMPLHKHFKDDFPHTVPAPASKFVIIKRQSTLFFLNNSYTNSAIIYSSCVHRICNIYISWLDSFKY